MPPKGTPSKETPAKGKKETANFRTFEAQSRLLAAVIASMDNPKLDYKKIAQYMGGSSTASSVEHRFRIVKAQASLLQALVKKGIDPAEKEVWKCTKKEEITTFFGASTPDGMGFHFRSVKKGAETLKGAVNRGESPIEAFSAHLNGNSSAAGSVPTTPAPKRARSTKATPGSTATPSTRRSKKVKIEPLSDDDVDSPELDYSEMDRSPSPIPRQIARTGELPPRVPLVKPDDKTKTPRPRPVPIAPALPRPAAPSYTLAPIPGIAMTQPELPNGYTDPATGYGYNVAPPRTAVGSTASSAASSPPAIASSPAAPATSFHDPTVAPANTALGMNSMNMGRAGHYAATAVSRSTSMNTSYSSVPSPAASASDAPTPQTIASSTNTVTASGMHSEPAGNGNNNSDERQFRSFTDFAPRDAAASGARNNSTGYSVNQKEVSYAAEVNFGGTAGEEEEEWDAGDV